MEQCLRLKHHAPTASINIAEVPKNAGSLWAGPHSFKVRCNICSSLPDHVIRFVQREIRQCLTTLAAKSSEACSAVSWPGRATKSVQLKPARHCQVHVNSTQWCHSSSVFRGKPIGQRFVSSMSDPLGASALFSNMYWYCPSAERVPSGPLLACL